MTSENKILKMILVAILILFIFATAVALGAILVDNAGFKIGFFSSRLDNLNLPDLFLPEGKGDLKGVAKFSSDDEFKNYITQAQAKNAGGYFGGLMMRTADDVGISVPETAGLDKAAGEQAVVSDPQRFSGTNVQVFDIDEPDIVKTDGRKIYFGSDSADFRILSGGAGAVMMERAIMPPDRFISQIKIINAWPATDLKIDGRINQSGEMLLAGKNLMVLNYQGVFGYDVTSAVKPEKIWQYDFKNNTGLVAARLYQNELYLITRTGFDYVYPCPVKPLVALGADFNVQCADIYRPSYEISADATYVIMKINPATGEVKKTISFVGSYDSAAVYMSAKAVYLTYNYAGETFNLLAGFIAANPSVFPEAITAKAAKLKGYDLSDNTKVSELMSDISRWYASLDDDERLKTENEINNLFGDYYQARIRELNQTVIVKIDTAALSTRAVGSVPGVLLNQFSVDENDDYLRLATTVGQNGGFWGVNNRDQSVSDVYVLNDQLKIVGAVKDLGRGERIYAARFIGDRGYVVTFRQTDPFYVLDLSSPRKPVLKGELKIPGYSSYLHPLAADLILGVGKENDQVKIALFDVSSAAEPKEIAKYSLNEYWSEAMNNHHAFLADTENKIFFLPGGQGGYVFSYRENKLNLVKALSGYDVKRAVFINDYFYILSGRDLTVFREADWSKISSLDLTQTE